MSRWIATISILLLIIGAVIWEQVYVNQTFNHLEDQIDALIASVQACGDENADTDTNKAQITEIEEYWIC